MRIRARRLPLLAAGALIVSLPAALAAQVTPRAIALPEGSRASAATLDSAMPRVAREALRAYRGAGADDSLNTTFRLQLLAGDVRAGLATLARLRTLRAKQDATFAPREYTQYEVAARASLVDAPGSPRWRSAVRQAFLALDRGQSDAVAWRVAASFSFDLDAARAQWTRALANAPTALPVDDAAALARQYFVLRTFERLQPVMPPALREAEGQRYVVQERVRIPLRNGSLLSAIVARPRALTGRQPAVLSYTIYAGAGNRTTALEAAMQGFVGVVVTSRGKRASPGPVRPWETEATDAWDVLEWIAHQPWSNGAVGMMGGSYDGFTQWAAAGTLHPALRTIVPAAAVAPGVDFPRENGVVLNFQYAWAQYVGRDALLDERAYGDRARWARLDSTWFARGSAYRALDVIDGTPNPLFRRWLDHPTFDAYWQAMMPSARAYAALAIPVLSITGYFDGAQPGALHYYRAHLAARPSANHTLLIGPWDHFGAQRRPAPVLGDLRLDPVANVDVAGLVYDWLRHVLRGAPRPALLADRVNFQITGTNRWAHVPSLAASSTDTLVFSLRAAGSAGTGTGTAADHRLVAANVPSGDTSEARVAAEVSVDFRDRTVTSSAFISTVSDTVLDRANGVAFESDPLADSVVVSGAFTTELVAAVTTRDVDLAVVLYERTADGRYRQLSYHLGRASLARDATRRQLLEPGVPTVLPLTGARFVSRVVPAGSRLVVVVQVNKNAESQLNYGSGKDPSDETLADALPLRLTLYERSTIRIPLFTR